MASSFDHEILRRSGQSGNRTGCDAGRGNNISVNVTVVRVGYYDIILSSSSKTGVLKFASSSFHPPRTAACLGGDGGGAVTVSCVPAADGIDGGYRRPLLWRSSRWSADNARHCLLTSGVFALVNDLCVRFRLAIRTASP